MGEKPMVEGSLAKKQPRVIVIEADKELRPKKLRVAAYARVSSDSTDQLNSFMAQVRYYTTYITSKEEWTFVDLYADEGITGTSAEKRTEFQRLIADCKRGLIDKVLCKSISRFARNTTDCLETIRLLKGLGVGVCFEEQNIDTAQMSGELLTAVFAAISQKESESISQNTQWGNQRRMANGTYCSPTLPYGYRREGKAWVIEPREAEIVRGIFHEYLSGGNLAEIAARLNRENVPNKLGKTQKWCIRSVAYILSNERYIGDSCWQKTYTLRSFPPKSVRNHGEREKYYVRDTHPPIVERELFEQVQALIHARRESRLSRGYHPTVFHQKMTCGHCGSGFHRRLCRGVTYWECTGHTSDSQTCPIVQIPEQEIQSAFLRIYHRLRMDGIPVLEQLAANCRKIREQKYLWRVDIVELNKQIGNLMDQNHMLAEMQKHGLVNSDFFLSQTNEIARKLREAQAQKERLLSADQDRTLEQTRELIEALASMPEFLPEFDEAIFSDLVERIIVESNTTLCFRLKNGLELRETIERTVR